jgi:hypothetical protein
VTGAQDRTGTSLSARGAAPPASLPAGPGRPGRAGGWRPGRAVGQAGPLPGSVPAPRVVPGLVSCAISVRDPEPADPAEFDAGTVWQPRFPGAELVGAAADLLPSITPAAGSAAELGEGPRWEIVVSPGVLRVRTRDYAKAERTHERQRRHHRADVDVAAGYLANGEEPAELLPTRARSPPGRRSRGPG